MSKEINNIDYKLQTQYLQDFNQKDSESENLLSIFDSDNEEIEGSAYTVEDFEAAYYAISNNLYDELYDVNSDNIVDKLDLQSIGINVTTGIKISELKAQYQTDCSAETKTDNEETSESDYASIAEALDGLSDEDKEKLVAIIDGRISESNDESYGLRASTSCCLIGKEEIDELKENGEFSSYDDETIAFFLGIEMLMKTPDSFSCDSAKAIASQGLSAINSNNMIEIITTILTDSDVNDIDVNEQIDDSEQGKTGDCWLLSTLNSLSYSEKGQQIIDDAITNNGDGTYSVEFKGVSTTVTISSEELIEAKAIGQYSTGDDDVLLMELAFEKVMDMVKNGEIEDVPDWLTDAANNGETSITSGKMRDAIYLLTGDETKTVTEHAGTLGSLFPNLNHNTFEYVYNLLEKNPDDYCAKIGFRDSDVAEGEAIVVQDIDGNDVILAHGGSGHAWSIKSVDGDYVTIVNPWDSSVEVTVLKSEIEKYVSNIEYYKYE